MSQQTEWVSYTRMYPDMQKATCPEGQWAVKQSEQHVAYASFMLPLPEGISRGDYFRHLPKDMDFGNDEHNRMWAHVSPQDDMVMMSTTDHVKEYIERLRAGPKNPDKTVEEILLDSGFEKNTSTVGVDAGYHIDCGTKGVVTVFVSDDSIDADYSGINADYWTNLAHVSKTITHADGTVHPLFWPNGSDPIRVAAEMITEVMVEWAKNTDLTKEARKGYIRPTNKDA